MRDQSFLLIDDVDAGLAAMSKQGRAIVTEGCLGVRSAVLGYAVRRGWTVVPHGAFAAWIHNVIRNDGRLWFTIDPLLPTAEFESRLRTLRVTRGPRGVKADSRGVAGGLTPNESRPIGIIDDAAASGTTLRTLIAWFRAKHYSVDSVLLCAATRFARDTLRQSISGVTWHEFMPMDDWCILHLRDACAFLPYSGRGSDHAAVGGVAEQPIEVRLHPSLIMTSPWRVLAMDASIRESMRAHRSQVLAKMQAAVSRDPLVVDLRLLGAGVAAVTTSSRSVDGSTRLRDLLGDADHTGTTSINSASRSLGTAKDSNP